MNTNTNPTVLISGAGVAGPTLAYWLARHGFRPTVVERAAGLRTSGSPVDVRGLAVPVAERMGVMERLRQAGTDATATSFVNRCGRRSAGPTCEPCDKTKAPVRLTAREPRRVS